MKTLALILTLQFQNGRIDLYQVNDSTRKEVIIIQGDTAMVRTFKIK